MNSTEVSANKKMGEAFDISKYQLIFKVIGLFAFGLLFFEQG